MEWLVWMEGTALATWVRESISLWAYPTIIALHGIGLAFLVGINAAIDLRILGFAPGLPLAPLERFFPLMWTGFSVNALSGLALMMANATTLLTNPVFITKLVFIALAVGNLQLLRSRVFGNPANLDTRPVSRNGKILAGTSLAFWGVAIIAGRLTAYRMLVAIG